MDYSKAVVYKICSKDLSVTECYVGSTTCLRNRRRQHKHSCCNERAKHHNLSVYQFIRANGGWDNWDVILLQEYPDCKSREQLLKYEREHFEKQGATLNQLVPSRKRRNKDEIKAYNRAYHEKHKDELNAKSRAWSEKNRDKIHAKGRERVECEFCGSVVSRNSLTRHRKTKTCLDWREL